VNQFNQNTAAQKPVSIFACNDTRLRVIYGYRVKFANIWTWWWILRNPMPRYDYTRNSSTDLYASGRHQYRVQIRRILRRFDSPNKSFRTKHSTRLASANRTIC